MKLTTKKIVSANVDLRIAVRDGSPKLLVDNRRWDLGVEGLGRLLMVLRGASEREVLVKFDTGATIFVHHVVGESRTGFTGYVIEMTSCSEILARIGIPQAYVFVNGLEQLCRDLVEGSDAHKA